MINKYKILSFLSTLNFILPFIGYQLVTTIFILPKGDEFVESTQVVTIPYRAITLLVSLLLILLADKKTIKKPSLPIIAFFVYWLLLIFRIIYDTYLRVDLIEYETSQLWLYIFGICIPIIISVYLTHEYINFDKSLYYIFGGFAVILLITLFNNQLLYTGESEIGRQNANIALNTISYGHVGVSTFFLGFFLIKYRSNNLIFKIIILSISILGIYSTLRSASRGPFLAVFMVFLFYVFSKRKKALSSIIVIFTILVIIILSTDHIIDFVDKFSPLMADRIKDSIYYGDSSDRNIIFSTSFNKFLDNPLFGSQFAHFGRVGNQEAEQGFIYSHNLILDALMGLGIIGGIIMIYILFTVLRNCYFKIHHNDNNFWISLILIQSISSLMFSGAFYYDPLFSMLMVLHLINKNYIGNTNINQLNSL